jgi:hypothetical protein
MIEGVSWSVAWDVVVRKDSLERATADEAKSKAQAATAVVKERPETDRQRQKREEREARRDQKWWDRYQERAYRESLRKEHPAYRAGRSAGDAIGLDPQVSNDTARRLI